MLKYTFLKNSYLSLNYANGALKQSRQEKFLIGFRVKMSPKGQTTAEQYLVYHFPLGWKMTPFEGLWEVTSYI